MTSDVASTVVVPIRLDAVWSAPDATPAERSVLGPAVNFSLLPRWSPDGDVHPDQAPLGESLVPAPFSDPDLVLGPGCHLHWHLPAAFRTIRHDPPPAPPSPGHVLAAPNRWVVERTIGEARERWLVESDHLGPAGRRVTGVAYPVTLADGSIDVRPLGRVLPESSWGSEAGAGAEHLDRLTAFGNGEPTFASFYPSCRTVFGLHDDGIESVSAVGVEYTVVGWYSDSRLDPLRTGGEVADPRADQLLDSLGWALADGGALEGSARTLYVGTTRLVEDDRPRIHGVAVGETASDALIEVVARVSSHGPTDEVRRSLEAVLHADALRERHADTLARLERLNLQRGFLAHPAQRRLRLRFAGTTPEADAVAAHAATTTSVDSGLTVQLAHLNAAQDAAHQASESLSDARRRLFDDWCRYLSVAYRADDLDGVEIELDRLRHHLATVAIPAVEAAEAELVAVTADAASIESDLRARVRRFNETVLDAAAPTGSVATRRLDLQELPGSPFWVPREPAGVVAMARGGSGSRRRNGTRDDGPLVCTVVELDEWPSSPARAGELIDQLRAKGGIEPNRTASRDETRAPLFVEWRADVEPDGAAPAGTQVGRSLATGHAADELMVATIGQIRPTTLLAFLEHEGIDRDPPIAAEHAAQETVRHMAGPEVIDRFLDWYEARPSGDDATPGSSEDFLVDTLAQISNGSLVGFTLDGLNARLLGHAQAYQLPVMDPLALDPHDDLVGRVARATRGATSWSPRGHDRFTPIRRGSPTITALRLVDSFGRCRLLAPGPDGAADDRTRTALRSPTAREPEPVSLVVAESLTSSDAADGRIRRRLVQPTRMIATWLASGPVEVEASDAEDLSPICGWLVCDELDGSLAVYDADGTALGTITERAEWRTVPGAPPAHSASIDGPHLRRVVAWLVRRGPTELATFHGQVVDALDRIVPEEHRQHQALALLMGRPVAVVRMAVGLELLGPPASDPSWDAATRHVLQGIAPPTGGVADEQFTVRLGEPGLVEDGLVGCWREDATTGAFVDDRYHAVVDDPAELPTTVTTPATRMTMLLDPTAALHLHCDILPTVAMSLPHALYDDALQRLAVAFEVGPVLAPTDTVALPLPDEPGMSWTWLERGDDGDWLAVPGAAAGKLGSVPRLVRGQTVREGWLRLGADDPDTQGLA